MNAITGQGEVALWRAVIQRAMSDAMPRARMHDGRPVLSSEHRREMGIARRWFAETGQDFRMVCDLALLESEAVAASARKAIVAFDRNGNGTAGSSAQPQMDVNRVRRVVFGADIGERTGLNNT